MLREIKIQNYRSIRDSTIQLSPFTLLIGANGTGKSNLMKLLQDLAKPQKKRLSHGEMGDYYPALFQQKHLSHTSENQIIEIRSIEEFLSLVNGNEDRDYANPKMKKDLGNTKVFSLVPQNAGNSEALVLNPQIDEDGQGIVRVLDSLKTGDREDLFHTIEAVFKEQIPEIEKLSFLPGNSEKCLQVRERHLPKPVRVAELSEGTQLALQIITILYQERKPSLICIEDIDKGLHPRLFQKIVQLCFDLTAEDDSIQIIATTHNPYLVDEFKGHESAVVIVEKTNGETTFTTLEDKLQNLDPGEEPLGSLWYSGFVGGVPQGV